MSEEKSIVKASVETGERGMQPRNVDEAFRLAQAVCRSDMFGRWKKPEDAMVAMLYGQEIGLTAIQSLDSISVINGKPTLGGDMALAKVRASGQMGAWKQPRFTGAEGQMDWACVVSSRRADSEEFVDTEFSAADAKRAGLWGRQGPWTQWPKRMLYYRALGFHLRDQYSDVLRGLVIAEEARDFPKAEENGQGAPAEPMADPLLDGAVDPPHSDTFDVPTDDENALHAPSAESRPGRMQTPDPAPSMEALAFHSSLVDKVASLAGVSKDEATTLADSFLAAEGIEALWVLNKAVVRRDELWKKAQTIKGDAWVQYAQATV